MNTLRSLSLRPIHVATALRLRLNDRLTPYPKTSLFEGTIKPLGIRSTVVPPKYTGWTPSPELLEEARFILDSGLA
jgi:hypothetical protein